jgi:predicted glycoside hydrolase/deacetylase ChbG (UPF0249 family)
MKYLIVSADDFGLLKSINEGIAKAYRDGIVTYLNLIPAGEAFANALEFVKDARLEEMGAHLSLTQVRPLTDPARIPTLISKDKTFHRSYVQFLLNFFSGRIDTAHIYIELKNQLEALKQAGIPITNLSSHEHIHMVPAILDIFIQLAKEYNIPSIRYLGSEKIIPPVTSKKIYKKFVLQVFAGKMAGDLQRSGVLFADNFLGFLDSGALQEALLINMLGSLKSGTTELVCHPGLVSPEVLDRCIFHANCETELHALTSRDVKDLVKEEGIILIKYGELARRKGEEKA